MQQQPSYATALQGSDPKLAEFIGSGRELILTDGALSAKVKTLMTMLCDALLAHAEGVAAISDRAITDPPRSPRCNDRRIGYGSYRPGGQVQVLPTLSDGHRVLRGRAASGIGKQGRRPLGSLLPSLESLCTSNIFVAPHTN